MSEWAKLSLEEKLTRPPIRRDIGPAPSDAVALGAWIVAGRKADMELKEEVSQQMELRVIYSSPGDSNRPAWQTLIQNEKRGIAK